MIEQLKRFKAKTKQKMILGICLWIIAFLTKDKKYLFENFLVNTSYTPIQPFLSKSILSEVSFWLKYGTAKKLKC